MGNAITLAVADGSRMSAYAARPAGKAERAVLVFQEAFGVNAHIRDVAQRFAAQGYLALAPEMFHRTAPPGFEGDYTDFAGVREHMGALTEAGMDHDIRAAHAWLRGEGATRIVAAGFCMGGRVAVQAASAVPLAAAAAFYGGNLPSLIPRVPSLTAPLLLAWGDRDTHIPREQRAAFADALRAQDKPFVECTFSEAGHAFFCDARAAYHERSAKIAWPLLLAFLAA